MATARRGMKEARISSSSSSNSSSTNRPPRNTPPGISPGKESVPHLTLDYDYDKDGDYDQTEAATATASTRELRSRARGGGNRDGDRSTTPTPFEDIMDGSTQHAHAHTQARAHAHTPPGSSIRNAVPSSPFTSSHTQCLPRTPPSTTTTKKTKCRGSSSSSSSNSGSCSTGSINSSSGGGAGKNKGIHLHHHQHKQKQNSNQGATPAFLIFICLLVVAGLYSLLQATQRYKEEQEASVMAQKSPPKKIEEVYEDLKHELQSLSRQFAQPREVWLGFLGQLGAVMVEEPPQPAVLMLVVAEDAKGAATCLVHHLAKAVQNAFEDRGFVMFDTRSSQHQHHGNAAGLKLELDTALGGLRTTHAAVVHNVESLPGASAMILHSYCDNENAPYKQTHTNRQSSSFSWRFRGHTRTSLTPALTQWWTLPSSLCGGVEMTPATAGAKKKKSTKRTREGKCNDAKGDSRKRTSRRLFPVRRILRFLSNLRELL